MWASYHSVGAGHSISVRICSSPLTKKTTICTVLGCLPSPNFGINQVDYFFSEIEQFRC